MQIKEIEIDKIIPYENNPRNNDEAVDKVANSIKEFGFKQPIVLDKDNVIVIGHTRLKASKKLGLKKVPCLYADDLTDDQIKALRLADNKTSEFATWDFEKLDLEIEDIELDLEPFGFDLDLAFDDDEVVEDEVPELPEEPKAKLGDIYQLGEHRLMCGDATSKEDVEKLLGGGQIKLLFTSPPYNMGGDMHEDYEDNLKSQEYIDFNLRTIENWKKHLRGYLFWNISYNKNARWEFIEILYRIIKETGLKFLELVLWNKKNAMPVVSKEMLTRQYEDILVMADEDILYEEMELYYVGGTEKRAFFNKKNAKTFSNYWEIGTNNTQLKNHKACFPVNLPARAIKLVTEKGDVVADCFNGSGSTLIACEQLGRKCYAMELDPHYIDITLERFYNLTGKKAKKVN